MKKYLIIPGVAKAGTTFLFDQLSMDQRFRPTIGKEINFFGAGGTLEQYQARFSEQADYTYFLDATPQYFQTTLSVLEHMHSVLPVGDVKQIVCLREPFSQIFSHYLHDIKRHIAHLDVRDKMMLTHAIGDVDALSKYLRPRAPHVKYLVEAFGRENVMAFSLKKSLKLPDFANDITQFLELDDTITFQTRQRSNSGGWLPKLLYARHRDMEFTNAGRLFRLPKGSLLVINGDESELVRNVDPGFVDVLQRGAAFWNHMFDPKSLGAAYDLILEDYRECLRLLDAEELEEDVKDVYRAEEPRIEGPLVDELLVAEDATTLAQSIWQSNVSYGSTGENDYVDAAGIPPSFEHYRSRLLQAKRDHGYKGEIEVIEDMLEHYEFSPLWMERLIALYVGAHMMGRLQKFTSEFAHSMRFVNIEKALEVAARGRNATPDSLTQARRILKPGNW